MHRLKSQPGSLGKSKERLFLRLEGDPLYAPETGVPAGTMREYPVPAALRDCVSSVIAYREAVPAGREVVERVLPDGSIRLIFDLADPAGGGVRTGQPTMRVIGASAAPALLRLRGRLEGVSLALRPGAATAVLGLPAGAIAGQAVAIGEVWPGAADEMLQRMTQAATDAARVDILLGALQRRLSKGTGPDQLAIDAARLVAEAGGIPLREVANAIGIGERRLQQIFQREVGLSPRTWRRLARMHDCLRTLRRHPRPAWSELAAQAGFYDQSHLANEFRALCGLSPSEFIGRAVSHSSKTGD